MTSRRTLAVMQPYVFPYAGYFSLLNEADVFVFYDDVNFIKKGWINRNRILVNGAAHTFTVPLRGASQNVPICSLALAGFAEFRDGFRKSLEQSYAKAPHFEQGMAYVERVLSGDHDTIAALAVASVEEAAQLLEIEGETCRSSEAFANSRGAERSDRLIEIARRLECNRYVNAIGGQELYEREFFARRGVELCFLKPNLTPYSQRAPEPVTGLSIIDLLMHLDVPEIRRHIESYDIL